MIKNYIKIAWRNVINHKLYSLINIGGLAIGMAVSFMLLLYVYNEFSFDKFNVNTGRLYTVLHNQSSNGEIITSSITPLPLGPALKKDFPEIDKVACTNWPNKILINYKDKALKIATMAADPALLDMFSFDFIYGDKQHALTDPLSIVLTQSAARSVFGDINPVGQIIKTDVKYSLKVSAVIKDNPTNSSFDFKALISWETLAAQQSWIKTSGWGNYSFMTYVMLKPGSSATTLNSRLKNVIANYDPVNKQNILFLYPFERLHLYGTFKNGVNDGGSIEYVRLFLFLAIGILLIACINFMNLSTARSEQRSREVGIRKAIGARRSSLVIQFMSESMLMAFIAYVISVILIQLLIPLFNTIIHEQLSVPYGNVYAWLSAIGVTCCTGLIAGSYPALFLSSFKPVKVLKGQLVTAGATVTPRKILVVTQFTFAICLILSSLFIYKQINFIRNRPVGYNQSGLIEMPDEGNMDKNFESFRQDAISLGAITDAAVTSGSITSANSSSWGITWQGQLPGEDKIPIDQIAVTCHFINTYGLKLVKGRDFYIDNPSDSTSIILNQAAVQMMRFKSPLGKIVKYMSQQRRVVGVVENFVWGSPYEPVKPAIIGFNKGWTGNIAIRLNPSKPVSQSIALVQNIYKKYNPEYPFEYQFTDERFSQKFFTEKLLANMSLSFTCLAIIISCLGLFGLAVYAAEQRRKEIGIRKVLGASVSSLWFKLSQEFVGLVIISFIIGSTISWYYIHQWLIKYTYHTSLSIWVFIATMLISIAICLIAVSWQAVKAACSNPVKSLRSE